MPPIFTKEMNKIKVEVWDNPGSGIDIYLDNRLAGVMKIRWDQLPDAIIVLSNARDAILDHRARLRQAQELDK